MSNEVYVRVHVLTCIRPCTSCPIAHDVHLHIVGLQILKNQPMVNPLCSLVNASWPQVFEDLCVLMFLLLEAVKSCYSVVTCPSPFIESTFAFLSSCVKRPPLSISRLDRPSQTLLCEAII